MLNILLFVYVAGKNGVYSTLVKHVREAFEECELVRINCQGMNGSDFRKIGAKLKVFFYFLHLMKKKNINSMPNFPLGFAKQSLEPTF